MDPTAGPRELLNKVQFDVRYYFCRRGSENIYTMTRETFKFGFDQETGINYILKAKDEATKNHQESNNPVLTGYMPDILRPDGIPHKMCPVRSFKIYLDMMNEMCPFFWQAPNIGGFKKGGKWFKNSRIGEATLGSFMADLSKSAKLSKRYTNHCIRVTGATNLTRANFSSNQIMAVTGHKSVNSLAMYQRVQPNEKLLMGASLAFNLLRPVMVYHNTKDTSKNRLQDIRTGVPAITSENSETAVTPITPEPNTPMPLVPINPVANVPNVAQNDIPYEQNSNEIDFDLLEFISDVNDDEIVLAATQVEQALAETESSKTTSSTTTTKKIMKKSVPETTGSMASFTNCRIGSIGTVNIHIHKN